MPRYRARICWVKQIEYAVTTHEYEAADLMAAEDIASDLAQEGPLHAPSLGLCLQCSDLVVDPVDGEPGETTVEEICRT